MSLGDMSLDSATGVGYDVEQVACQYPPCPLKTFAEMWYQVFLWALCSSFLVHVVAATIGFATLRKHKFGK